MSNVNETEMEQLLQSLKISLPLVQRLFPIDVMFALADTDKFIYYLPGTELDIRIQEGAAIPQNGGIRTALVKGEEVSANIPKEIYGLPFKSSSMPIHDQNGAIAGVFTIGISLSNQETLSEAANALAVTSEEISSTSEEIAGTASDLANTVNDLKELGQRVVTDLQQTDEILEFIRKVADNSNLLGLNAAIEAAHAAEHGRGFGIVAQEIRKMSVSSASSAKDIAGILQLIKQNISQMDAILMDCLAQSERQAAATEEITASMQQLAASAVEIEKIARLI
ncbi:methyl-accepting chemotaxis protein [Paenibacillus sp. MMS20-IR301]|uniref:methyl-accepting chemotaxis protein n=1 Tax=Paenibacillus sp. MMS20-IR301 TaxID=2895946 RepID=UPI0028E9095D|nr:methyl-accepting chemotaxis protein [Paenibacillus sp. MMS20-IR301]WNS44621.1 methyl-accepting chemotaxis protein [Paenibacillus sp. MMS20-IR301]